MNTKSIFNASAKVAVLGIACASSVTGCVAGEEVDEWNAPSEIYEEQDGGGDPFGGNNGLDSDANTAKLEDVQDAYAVPLTSNGTRVSDPLRAAFGDAQGLEVFQYMVRCGVAAGAQVVFNLSTGTSVTFVGEGIMELVTDWRYNPLTTADQERVTMCMMALLNPYGVEEIRMVGSEINGNGATLEYWTQEAWWVAKWGVGGDLVRKVYPLPSAPYQNWSERVCGTLNGNCGIEVVTSATQRAQECVSGPNGTVSCLGRPAVSTYICAGSVFCGAGAM